MNLKPHALKPPRGIAQPLLVACLCLAPSLVATRAQAQQPSNNSQAQQSSSHTKRITPLRTSEGAQGSRVTITSDGEMNDYTAYRSGDRFIVVIPQAQGGGDAGVKGRGFDGAQVSRRGNDLVYTFKLQPGASAKVNQRFNRLDVQFTAPKQADTQGSTTAAPTVTPRTAPEVSGIKTTPTPNASQIPANARANQTTSGATQTTVPATNPNEISPSLAITPAPSVAPSASPSVAPSASPAAAASTPEQIAQNLPTPAAPVSIVAPSTAAPTSTLGATVVRNWRWLIAALLGIGVVLLLVSRRGERQPIATPPASLSPAAPATKPIIKEATTAKLEPVARARTTESIAAATTAATVAATAERAALKSKKKKRGKKDRAVAQPSAKVETTQPRVADVTATEATAPTPATGEATAAETKASMTADAATKVAEAASIVAAASTLAPKSVDEKRLEADAPAADTQRVGEEVGKLLAGESYDESVVGASDTATREAVAAELLAALSGRHPVRNARAREAFLKHNYFDDATRNLQSAEAPAQRASAAHALSLLRDRAATPHLVAALEDPSAEVRRASVEALAELRDPAALGPLEALRWRETSRLVTRTLIQRAVEASTPTGEETEETEETLLRARDESIAPTQESATATQEPAVATDATAAAEVSPTATPENEVVTVAGVEIPATEIAALTTDEAATEIGRDATTGEATSGIGRATTTGEASAAEHTVAEVEPAMVERSSMGATESVEAFDPATSVDTADALDTTTEFGDTTEFDDDATIEAPSISEPLMATERDAESLSVESPVAEPQVARGLHDETESVASQEATAEVEHVYTFDESEAAAWSEQGDERVEADARRGTGGLESAALAENIERADAVDEVDEAAESHVYVAPEFAVGGAQAADELQIADDWLDLDVEEQRLSPDEELTVHAEPALLHDESVRAFEPTSETSAQSSSQQLPSQSSSSQSSSHLSAEHVEPFRRATDAPQVAPPTRGFEFGDDAGTGLTLAQKGIEVSGTAEAEDVSIIPKSIQLRLGSDDASERAASVRALARLNTGEAFQQICAAFDDPAPEVRDAAARALYEVSDDRADSFTRALRESPPDRRRQIGASLSSSGLADEAVSQLTGESREKTYDAFSLLFLMAKAGETAPLIHAIESHPETEVRLAVVKLLALSGQQEVLPSFKRLAVRGSLPAEVRAAVMEAIYQISSAGTQQQAPKPTGA